MAEAATSASERAPLLVASIDFGTTYSGCAFSFKSDFDRNPCEVSFVNIKYGEKQGCQAERVPTCILFRPHRKFHSFGFDARTAYCKLADDYKEKAKDWYFFEHFKMRLRMTRLRRDFDILDQTMRKSMKALDVIAEAIRYLKDLLLRELQARTSHVKASDIVWVLTVPAIWDEAARQFMREAAEMAGIKSDRLRLALEPEAAAMFCHFHFLSGKEVFAEKGKRFMTVDCGGGTVDISVLEVAEQGKLKQLHKAHGAACGGTKVDDAFWRLLSDILGPGGMPSVKHTEMVELMQNFELAKCQMGPASNRVGIELPESFKEPIGIRLDESSYNDRIRRMGNTIRLLRDLYITFFEESKNGIINAMEEVLSSQDVSAVDVILLVGGLAKSTIIVDAVKAAFPDRRVLVPPSPDLTVLMGAVQFGHCPQAIATRVSPYTYGVSTTYVSRPGDDPSKVEKVDGVKRTEDKATRSSARREAPFLVASIDFGTTYSGSAFSFRSDFESRPCSVNCVNVKYGGKQWFQAERVPTCILFNPQGKFDSFGLEALQKYSEMVAEQNEVDQWYFFERFKMELREREEQDLTRDLDLLDQTKKKSMKALDVIAEAIHYLKDLLLRELKAKTPHVKDSDIVWVLTVPAIWNDAARQFMREAAVKAGIVSGKLMLALEPEVASIFCHYQTMEGRESFTGKGKRFMVVDCGGGTVDISVFRDVGDGTLIQEHRPHGAHCGGTKVDEAFEELLQGILTWKGLASINNKELVQLMQNFEMAKQQMNGNDAVWLRMPNTVEKVLGIYLSMSKYKTQLALKDSNLRLPREIFEPFFEESKDGIIKAMKEVLSSKGVSPVDVILLVGGLAKSTIIVNAVKAAFPDRRVLVPPSPDLTVLMGAVQFGHCPQAIATRVSPYTYGVSTTYVCRPGDDPSKVEKVDGVERTEDKATRSSVRREAALLVASIDFGTTYSGSAFSFRSDFESRPCSVNCVNVKYGGKQWFQAERVPTCILFNPQGKFDTFGLEALQKYSEMVAKHNEEVDQWYFFERFKMELREREEKDLTRDLDLLDQTKKKSMKALDVIAEAIRYLKNLLLRELKAKTSQVKDSDIVWVLTVPAIWNDAARQFMREAAVKAGIVSEKLMLALEPEAASIFCHYQTMEGRESFMGKGKRFMVVDCGGGTVDISVFRDAGDGTLIQEHRPHGAHCGGTKVDDAFEELLHGILKMKGLASINNKELVQLMQNFEMAKQEMNGNDAVWLRMPKTVEKALRSHLATSKYKDKLELKNSNLRLPREIFEPFFEESKDGIIKAMKEVLSSKGVSPVDVILLVGGLAKSSIIVNAVKEAFPDRRVLLPNSPDLTVLMGAVQFGHCPVVITTRVSPYTYGISTTYESRPGDDPSKVEKVDGVERTKDIFEVLIKVNQRVSIEQEMKPFEFKPIHPNQQKMTLDLYRTLSPDPKYVTDAGCEKVASIEVDMPDTTGDKRRRVQMSLSVSGTELRVVAKDGKTGKEFKAKCDFLENKAKS